MRSLFRSRLTVTFVLLFLIICFVAAVYLLVNQYAPNVSIILAFVITILTFFLTTTIIVVLYQVFIKSNSLPADEINGLIENINNNDFSKRLKYAFNDEYAILKKNLNNLFDNYEKIKNTFDSEVSREIEVTKKNLGIAETQNEMLKNIKQELEKFKLAVEDAPIHIIITDSEGKIVYANIASSKITGYTISEMIGQTPALWGGQMPKDFYSALWNKIKVERQMFKGELKNRRKNNQLYDAEVRISPVLSPDSIDPVFYVGIEEDVTERKIIDKMKTDFISLASHQLRTPITAIRWLVEGLLAKSDNFDKSDKQIIEKVYHSTLRMVNLVKTLLNISRLQAGKLVINPKEIDIAEMIAENVNNVKLRFKDKNPKIIMNIEENLILITDYELISNVIENLLTNAVKYSDAESEIKIIVRKTENSQIKFEVYDLGIGIPDEEKDKIFNRFYRASNAIISHEDGSGLGLFMIKQIIEILEGQIIFEPNGQRGTIFKVIIPAKYQVKNV
jgi:PAS domain S-box-containing protein